MLPQYFKERYFVDKTTGCWQWFGNLTGRDKRAFAWWEGKTRIAARAVWKLVHGKYPDKCVLHTCDNPACINPDHLYLGTQADNARDRQTRGRNVAFNKAFRGSKNGASKLTEIQVRKILQDDRTHSTIAITYGVSRSNIQAIKAGKLWAHLQEGGGRGQ